MEGTLMANEPSSRRDDASPQHQEPLGLNYRAPTDDPPTPGRLRFWHGLLAGFALPAFWWFSGINHYFHVRQGLGAFGGMVVLAVLEMAFAFAALFIRKWRRFGIGLLISVPLIALIFFGTCWAIFSMK
jgi:hypothetical protein